MQPGDVFIPALRVKVPTQDQAALKSFSLGELILDEEEAGIHGGGVR